SVVIARLSRMRNEYARAHLARSFRSRNNRGMSRDPRIDAYIARQADFARPILEHLRETVLAACPEAEETLKWSMPNFLYRGKILANMAAFKAHAAFGFWRSSEVLGETGAERESMGQFGRLTSIGQLPPPEE